MERVTETKLSLEALRQMKSHGRTAAPTLIGAIEQIVNRAIETHLDEPFYSEAASVVFQKVCLDRSLQILQICKYNNSCF